MSSEKIMISAKYSESYEHLRWAKTLPFLKFRSDWFVQVYPPTMHAIVRFKVKKNDRVVSVYFDGYDLLGYCGQPYWEIYPAKNGDIDRFVLGEEDEMMEAIEDSLNEMS